MRAAERTRLAALGALVALAGCHHAQVRPEPLPVEAQPSAPPPPSPTEHNEPTTGGVYHVVQKGETLYRIARAYGLTPEELAEDNALADPRDVAVGTKLFIRGAKQSVPLPDLSVDGAAVDPASAGTARPVHASGCVGPQCFAWPLRGVIYARFGKHGLEQHEGLDLAAPEGTPIAAAAKGTVIYAGEQQGYGTLVIVQHEGGLVTLYAHNRENLVKDGQGVAQGQIIARVGSSGRTSGPHCHFEVRRGNAPIDPLPFLPSPAQHGALR